MPFLSRTNQTKKEARNFQQFAIIFLTFLTIIIFLQRHIKNLQQLAQLPSDDRRALLKSIPDEQYADIIKVLGTMPYIDFQVRCEGVLKVA